MEKQILDKIDKFFSQYKQVEYTCGQTIALPGEEPPGVIYLTSGLVGQSNITDAGQKVILNIFKPPAFFPMSWALNKTPSKFFIEALSSIECRIAPPEEVLEFLNKNPEVITNLLSRVYKGTDGLMDKIFELSVGTAKSRLYQEILVSALRFGKVKPNGTATIKITTVVLAERTGMARETISRELKKLEAEGQISRKKSQITVKTP